MFTIALIITIIKRLYVNGLCSNTLQLFGAKRNIDGRERDKKAETEAKRRAYHACWIDPQKGNF